MSSLLRLIFVVLATLPVVPTAAALEPAHPKAWTVLVYWAVDNDLYGFSQPYLHALERIGTTAKINIVVEYDYPGFRPTERILVGHSTEENAPPGQDLIASTLLETHPFEQNSADPAVLADFLRWGVSNFPAERYEVVIASHGSNWSGAISDATSRSDMSLKEVRQALESANRAIAAQSENPHDRIDLLVFDACRMSFQETVHELETVTPWIVGSPLDVNGFDHVTPLSLLDQNPTWSGKELGAEYVRAYPKRSGNRGEDAIAASLLKTAGAHKRTSALEDLFSALLELPRRELNHFWNRLPKTVSEDGDWAIDLGDIVGLAPSVPADLLDAFGSRNLSAVRDPDSATSFLLNPNPAAAVAASSYTDQTSRHSGISLTCAKKLDRYAVRGAGRYLPSWVNLCRNWTGFERTSIRKPPKPF